MSVKLSREKIKRMVDMDGQSKSVRISNSGSGGDSGGGSGGGGGVTWWQYSPADDKITFIKTIAKAVFDRLRITTRLIFGNSDEADTYITGIADDQTSENSTHDIVTPSYGKEKYLSREHDDTAQGFITMLEGEQIGDEFISGILGQGGVFRKDADGKTYIEADKLYIRMRAYFDSVEIREYIHTSGNRIASPAQGFVCSRVEWLDANGDVLEQVSSNLPSVEKFRCYWRVDDGDIKTDNQFIVGDMAFCQNAKVENGILIQKRFWRMVVGRNEGTATTENGEAWIDLSNDHDANGDPVMTTINYTGQGGIPQSMSVLAFEPGSDIPTAEDNICMLGDVRDATRQGAIIEYVSGENAPSYQIYQGIGSDPEDPYTLVDKNYVGIGYNSATNRAYLTVYGDAYIGAREGEEGGYVRYDQGNRVLEVNGRLNVGSTLADGRNVNALGTSRGNMLLNSSFTGDYDSEEVDSDTDVTPDTIIFSDPLKHWTSDGVSVIESAESQSGYAAKISGGGNLQQNVALEVGKWYVLSFRGKGGSLTYSIGGVTGQKTLKQTVDSYDVPFVCEENSGLAIMASSEVIVMELQLCEGNLPSAWKQNYKDGEKTMAALFGYEYIRNAINNGSTDIIGGLILSQIIKVGKYRNKQMTEETGGMSGAYTDDDSPFLWGGGNMSQAIYTIAKYAADPSYQATDEEVEAMAKFVVTHGGRAILNDIILRGYIYALGGKIGGFNILSDAIKSVNEHIILNADGSATIGKATIDTAGNVSINDLTANNGTFGGVVKAESGMSYKTRHVALTGTGSAESVSTTLDASDVFITVLADGDYSVAVNLPSNPLEGQMVYIANSYASSQYVVVRTNNANRYIYPRTNIVTLNNKVSLDRNASISFVYSTKENPNGSWWIFSANNT